MARLPYIDMASASDPLINLYESQLRISGYVPNFHLLLGHVPRIYAWYLPFQKSVQLGEGSSLPEDLRALASLATSEVNRCRYCATHGQEIGQKAGVAAAKASFLQEHPDAEPDPEVFDVKESIAIEWARAVTKNEARRASDLFRRMEEHFSTSEIVELTVVIAARTFTNLIQEALWTDLEDGVDRDHERGDITAILREHAQMLADGVGFSTTDSGSKGGAMSRGMQNNAT